MISSWKPVREKGTVRLALERSYLLQIGEVPGDPGVSAAALHTEQRGGEGDELATWLAPSLEGRWKMKLAIWLVLSLGGWWA